MINFNNLINSKEWRSAEDIARQVELRSVRVIEQLISHLKAALPLLVQVLDGSLETGPIQLPFPKLSEVCPEASQVGKLFNFERLKGIHFQIAGKKEMYQVCVKTASFKDLHERCDTKWREKLAVTDYIFPSWRLFYKSPLPKHSGDFQWRILHCVLATNVFVSKMNLNVLPFCHFCNNLEMVFHVFIECSRLVPLFALLEMISVGLGFDFNKILFIYGCRYSKVNKERCTVANFIFGQAK